MQNRLNSSDKITFELAETTVLRRWPCDVCFDCTEKVSVLCEAADGSGLRVCERCLEGQACDAGFIDRKLSESAHCLECQAKETRALIGRLLVPTFQQWQTRLEQVCASRFAALKRTRGGTPARKNI
jgi:hypothetical protein